MFIEVGRPSRLQEDILPFEVGYLPDIYQKKAEIELRETPENKEKCLRLIREMAIKEKSLVFDDDFLLQYLRCRKYNVSRAFSQLKAFVNLKKKNAEAFTNIKFESIEVSTRNKIVTFLPYRCRDGCAIFLVQLDNWNPEEFPLEDVKRMVVVMLLQALRDPMTQVNGFKVIFDVKSNPIRHIRYCTPSNLYLLYHGTQECVPGRFKGIHIVNQSLTFKAAWVLLKHFLSDKFKKRIHFHSGSETLTQFFPKSILPADYGGDLEDYDMTDWLRRVTEPEKLATMGGGATPV